MSTLHDCRASMTTSLEQLAADDPRIVVVVNDSVGSGKLGGFRSKFPRNLVNVGIAEQNMIGVAAGLANGGKIPFVCGASPFVSARALEQIKVDLAYSEANVKLCVVSPGLAYGEFGATHHSIEDVAWMRAIAQMTIIVPADMAQTSWAVRAAAEHRGPVFVRVSRMGVPSIYQDGESFRIGRAITVRDGSDVTLIANGTMLSRALSAADLLAAAGVEARVLDMATVKPLDREAVIAAARETRGIITIEEHTIVGGLGSAVAEVVVTNCPVPMRLIGVPDVFAPTGSTHWLFEHFGLTASNICGTAQELLANRNDA